RLVGGGGDDGYDVLDADTLTLAQTPAQPAQLEEHGSNIDAVPVYWAAADRDHGLLYQIPRRGSLKAFRYDKRTHLLEDKPAVVSELPAAEGMWEGGASVSANGDRDGILWVSHPLGHGEGQSVPGRLTAFDARSLRE